MRGGVSRRGRRASLIEQERPNIFTASARVTMPSDNRRLCAVATPAYADTLQEALTQAYINNPTLMAARATLRATDAQVEVERADGRPSANANGSVTEFIEQSSTSFFTPDRAFNLGVDLGVPIYSGGAIKNRIRAADQRVEAGRADLRGTESAVFSRVRAS